MKQKAAFQREIQVIGPERWEEWTTKEEAETAEDDPDHGTG